MIPSFKIHYKKDDNRPVYFIRKDLDRTWTRIKGDTFETPYNSSGSYTLEVKAVACDLPYDAQQKEILVEFDEVKLLPALSSAKDDKPKPADEPIKMVVARYLSSTGQAQVEELKKLVARPKEAVPALESALKSAKDEDDRWLILAALGKLRTQ